MLFHHLSYAISGKTNLAPAVKGELELEKAAEDSMERLEAQLSTEWPEVGVSTE